MDVKDGWWMNEWTGSRNGIGDMAMKQMEMNGRRFGGGKNNFSSVSPVKVRRRKGLGGFEKKKLKLESSVHHQLLLPHRG
jgi:hypothetical protein